MENLKFYNGFGGFSNDGKEYIIKLSKKKNLPTVWSHVLANEHFGTIITNNLGGYTYTQNSRLCRLTAWANTPENDIPSEIIYLKDTNSGSIWTLNANVMPDNEDYTMIFGFGYAITNHSCLGIIQENHVFVPKDDKVKINLIRLKNTLSDKRRLKIVYYLKPVLGEDETKTSGYIDLSFDKDDNFIIARNLYGDDLVKNVYVSSSEKITSYTGNNLSFIGNGDLNTPNGVFKPQLSFENALRCSFVYCN